MGVMLWLCCGQYGGCQEGVLLRVAWWQLGISWLDLEADVGTMQAWREWCAGSNPKLTETERCAMLSPFRQKKSENKQKLTCCLCRATSSTLLSEATADTLDAESHLASANLEATVAMHR